MVRYAVDVPGQDDNVPDEPHHLDRLISAGISEDRARDHLAAGRIRLDGEVVTDPATPAPAGPRPVVAGQLTDAA